MNASTGHIWPASRYLPTPEVGYFRSAQVSLLLLLMVKIWGKDKTIACTVANATDIQWNKML